MLTISAKLPAFDLQAVVSIDPANAFTRKRETLAVDRNAPEKTLDQFRLHPAVETRRIPKRLRTPATAATAALQPAVRQPPTPPKPAIRASRHRQILQDLVQIR